jgi:hypothetical protein
MQDGAGTRKSARAEDMEDESDVEEVPEVVNEYVNNVPGGLGVPNKLVYLAYEVKCCATKLCCSMA